MPGAHHRDRARLEHRPHRGRLGGPLAAVDRRQALAVGSMSKPISTTPSSRSRGDLVAGGPEHRSIRRLLGSVVAQKRRSPFSLRRSCQVLEQQGRQAAAVVLVVDEERHLGGVGPPVALVAGDADDLVAGQSATNATRSRWSTVVKWRTSRSDERGRGEKYRK